MLPFNLLNFGEVVRTESFSEFGQNGLDGGLLCDETAAEVVVPGQDILVECGVLVLNGGGSGRSCSKKFVISCEGVE